jgi:hypothetical protein
MPPDEQFESSACQKANGTFHQVHSRQEKTYAA